jgi:hypothetical protein
MIVGLLAPIASIVGAVIFYVEHSNRVGRENRMPVLGYIVAIATCGAIGGYLGLTFGIAKACGGPNPGNLCGLWGGFVTGPISFAATVLLVAKLISTTG